MGNTELFFIKAPCVKKTVFENAEDLFCWRADTAQPAGAEKSQRAPSGVASNINTALGY